MILVFSELNCRSNFWLQTIILKSNSLPERDKILKSFHKNKILARPVWKPLHMNKFLKKYPKMDLTNAKILYKKIVNLPSSSYL